VPDGFPLKQRFFEALSFTGRYWNVKPFTMPMVGKELGNETQSDSVPQGL